MIKILQTIYAGLGGSVQLSVGRYLNEWLMNNDNMSRWGGGTMTASERRSLQLLLWGKQCLRSWLILKKMCLLHVLNVLVCLSM